MMIHPQKVIQEAVHETIKELFDQEATDSQIQIQPTRKEFEGEFTVVVFPLLKISKNAPEKTGQLIGEKLKDQLPIDDFSVVKGFLNLKMKTSFWVDHLKLTYDADSYGFSPPNSKPLVMVEYSSPNTNKPLHLGVLVRRIRNHWSWLNILRPIQISLCIWGICEIFFLDIRFQKF